MFGRPKTKEKLSQTKTKQKMIIKKIIIILDCENNFERQGDGG